MAEPTAPSLPSSSLPKPGADQLYEEFNLSVFYSQDHSKQMVSITSGDHIAMGRILKRDASRLKLIEADEALGIDDGGPWIDRQMGRQHLPLGPSDISCPMSRPMKKRLGSPE